MVSQETLAVPGEVNKCRQLFVVKVGRAFPEIGDFKRAAGGEIRAG